MGAIEIKDLCKSFKLRGKGIKALDNLTFSVEEGEIYGFLGPNGAGKSTTIKILMDLIRADSGEARMFGVPVEDFRARIAVGFMPENPQYYDNLTGFDLLMLTAGMYKLDIEKAKKKAWELLELFELKDSAKKQIRKYSKGMVQRIGFASSIVHEPKLLILDEPMSGLDPLGRILFKQVMKDLNSRGVTIFFSSHIIPDIEEICTKVVMIKSGKVIKQLDSLEIKHLSTFGFSIIVKKDKIEGKGFEYKDIGGDIVAIDVSKEDFMEVMDKIKSMSAEIIDINPIKTNLEDLFIKMM
ncbi:MAG: ABC transporter ATP-binding protein [Calditerrivibrio sp.]|nr:ABC transporter ATP-binding protein [Calditerrivibrio sp.]